MMENCLSHDFQDIKELQNLRSSLLGWYDKDQRDLPWRTLALTESDVQVRAYSVWVSEIMLQQTQVSRVVDYYKRWIKKWPTVESLAAATLEEVRAAWSGLGYYSRGENLWKGARKVVSEMGGVIPNNSTELMSSLPGVGKYTAGAIASIAFRKVAGVVDGNVVRVLCRQRAIGRESSCQAVTKHLWGLAEACVDPERPGDFNQALMELGATVCTPKNPRCQDCPVSTSCLAYRKEKEDRCSKRAVFSGDSSGKSNQEQLGAKCALCLKDWIDDLGVSNYPHKTKKKPPPTEEYCVAVIKDEQNRFLLRQRKADGLLAGLWEFPAVLAAGGVVTQAQRWKQLQGAIAKDRHFDGDFIGTVTHHFSHVHHHYHCWYVGYCGDGPGPHPHQKVQLLSTWLSGGSGSAKAGGKVRWTDRSDLCESAVPASVKKIIKLLDSHFKGKRPLHGVIQQSDPKRQKTLNTFLKTEPQ